jgi:hypothetical protein
MACKIALRSVRVIRCQSAPIFYQSQDSSRDYSGVGLVIVEKQVTGQPTGIWDGYPENAVEEVMVGRS